MHDQETKYKNAKLTIKIQRLTNVWTINDPLCTTKSIHCPPPPKKEKPQRGQH